MIFFFTGVVLNVRDCGIRDETFGPRITQAKFRDAINVRYERERAAILTNPQNIIRKNKPFIYMQLLDNRILGIATRERFIRLTNDKSIRYSRRPESPTS